MQEQSAKQRRKNFFERKRLLNYEAHDPQDIQNKPLNELSEGRDRRKNSDKSGSDAPNSSPSKNAYPLDFDNNN